MNWKKSLFLILTDDQALKETLGPKLKEWGADVFYLGIGDVSPFPRKAIQVALIDVRQKAPEVLHYFNTIKGLMPFAESLIVNRSGNISASMEGMRSGAGEELLVPFDTVTLRKKINAALERSKQRREKSAKRTIFSGFGDAMTAATFAQAGEFETALAMLDGPGNGPKERVLSDRKDPDQQTRDSNREKEKK